MEKVRIVTWAGGREEKMKAVMFSGLFKMGKGRKEASSVWVK